MEDEEIFWWENRSTLCRATKSKTTTTKKEVNMTDNKETLYEIDFDGKIMYGHKLAVNSLGLFVMEIKGSGDIIAVDKEKISKVMPFTIGVQFADKGQIYHYLAEVGKFDKDEYHIVPGYNNGSYQIAHIVDVNTKSDKAVEDFKSFKKIS